MYIVIDRFGKARVFKNEPNLVPVYKQVLSGEWEDPYGKFHEEYVDGDEVLYYEYIDSLYTDDIFNYSERHGIEVNIDSFNDEIKQMKHESKPIKI